MKPVYQTTFGEPNGNCFAACVASLLEIPIEQVPEFMHKDGKLNWNWYDEFRDWLLQYGYTPLMLNNDDPGWITALKGAHYLMGVKGSHGRMHSVIGFNGEVVHDPYKHGTQIVEVCDYIVFVRTFK